LRADNDMDNQPGKMTAWQLVMLVLCVYVLAAMFVGVAMKLPGEVQHLLDMIDAIVCFVFLADFFVHLWIAPSKLGYLKWGWIDLISSIPSVPVLRVGRLARIVRILRLLRGVRAVKAIVQLVYENRAKGVFTAAAIISFVLVVFSAIVALNSETDATNANIKTAGDALWWAFSTITSVGYGDVYPVTFFGRMAGVILMTAGVGLFGIFTAFMATKFMEPADAGDEKRQERILEELGEIRKRLDEMERK
jgi:voltage-gated potassium channel